MITLPDERYEAYCNQHSDFIRKHIFPGGHLPSFTAMQTVAASNGLQLHNALDIGEDYAVSLRHWRERMLARADEARGFGYPERFLKMYEFYFVYCEAGFANRCASGRVSGRALGARSPPNPALLSTGSFTTIRSRGASRRSRPSSPRRRRRSRAAVRWPTTRSPCSSS